MDKFQENLSKFTEGVKISDLLGEGASFNIDTNNEDNNYDLSSEIDLANFPGSEDYILPIDTPFDELKFKMDLVSVGVWKKVYKAAKSGSTLVDFSIHRVTYHRNLYMENDLHPFDSTYLNGKPDIINPTETYAYLEGILDALSTMKEGEQAYFVISYRKMYKESGCQPRVSPFADIFCDLKVTKIEEVGNQAIIDNLKDSSQKSFQEAQIIYNDGRLRAKNLFQNRKIEGAIKIYEKIKQMLEFCKTENDTDILQQKELIIQNLTNLGLCYNLRDEPNKALSMIRQIEKLCDINENSKILYIKGKSLRMTGEYETAAVALKKANKLAPQDSKIVKELEKLDSSMANYKMMMKSFSKNLLN